MESSERPQKKRVKSRDEIKKRKQAMSSKSDQDLAENITKYGRQMGDWRPSIEDSVEISERERAKYCSWKKIYVTKRMAVIATYIKRRVKERMVLCQMKISVMVGEYIGIEVYDQSGKVVIYIQITLPYDRFRLENREWEEECYAELIVHLLPKSGFSQSENFHHLGLDKYYERKDLNLPDDTGTRKFLAWWPPGSNHDREIAISRGIIPARSSPDPYIDVYSLSEFDTILRRLDSLYGSGLD
jgi:hypothetical protein